MVHMVTAPIAVPVARYLSLSETARAVKYAVLPGEGCGEARRRRSCPVELAWTYMEGVPPATTSFSPLEEKMIDWTFSVWEMVACRVSSGSHILTVWPAAVVPKIELGLA